MLGDGEAFLLIAATTAFQWGVIWLAARLRRGPRLPCPWAVLFAASGVMLLGVAGSTSVLQFITAGLSEYPTWIALPYVFTMLVLSRSPVHGLLGTAALGLSFLTRTNQAPALLALLLVFLARAWRDRRRVALGGVGVLIVLVLLPVAHNVYYGGRAVLIATTGGIPENVVAPPSLWLAAASDPAAREEVWRHLRYLLYLTTTGEGFLQVVMHGLQLAWLAGLIGLVVARRPIPLHAWVAMALPVLYLGVHLVYQVQVYYPRHLVAGHLAMGVTAMYAARLGGGPSRAMRDREPSGRGPAGPAPGV
jgi:hypothetical protein